MMRNDLLTQLSALPPDADVGIQLGDDHLDIAGLVPWGDGFVALTCHAGDLRDVLRDWGLSVSRGESRSLRARRRTAELFDRFIRWTR
jgi:hypothetical protein